MLVLPLLVAFAAMGFTKLISLTVPQMPEDIKIEYEANEAFEFESFGQTMELKGMVIPETSAASLVWSSSNNEVAAIDGTTLTFLSEGTTTISASLPDGSFRKSFEAMLMVSGDTPKYIKANYATPTEKGDTVVGLLDFTDALSGGETKGHTEVINVSVLPSKASQEITVEGLPAGTYSVDGAKLSFTPKEVGVYTAKISSAEKPEIFGELRFEVKDCVNVYSYEDLLRATNKSENGTAMALRVNLESEANLGRANSRHLAYASGAVKFRVLELKENVKKDEAASLYEIIAE